MSLSRVSVYILQSTDRLFPRLRSRTFFPAPSPTSRPVISTFYRFLSRLAAYIFGYSGRDEFPPHLHWLLSLLLLSFAPSRVCHLHIVSNVLVLPFLHDCSCDPRSHSYFRWWGSFFFWTASPLLQAFSLFPLHLSPPGVRCRLTLRASRLFFPSLG